MNDVIIVKVIYRLHYVDLLGDTMVTLLPDAKSMKEAERKADEYLCGQLVLDRRVTDHVAYH